MCNLMLSMKDDFVWESRKHEVRSAGEGGRKAGSTPSNL
ncbi:WSSV089 [White spot syndrome virus]|uniref:WSSV089 n=1 Tax=White spot syndrome virus TaxID=342409 RepID=A0A2I6SBL0_9VIRU|nr:WSSV089 [White spot syndrome virus]